MSTVLVTGGFDPLHSSHVEFIETAATLGDRLVVGLNSDSWLTRKKGRPFMSFTDRFAVLDALKAVDEVIDFDDSDDTARDAIDLLLDADYAYDLPIVFANGGDRGPGNCLEIEKYEGNSQVVFAFNVGGEKRNSSSTLVREWEEGVERSWGTYRTIGENTVDDKSVKIKELVLGPGGTIKFQRHNKRDEYWNVVAGRCEVRTELPSYTGITVQLAEGQQVYVPARCWHSATAGPDGCTIIEVQYGSAVDEDDIERKQHETLSDAAPKETKLKDDEDLTAMEIAGRRAYNRKRGFRGRGLFRY